MYVKEVWSTQTLIVWIQTLKVGCDFQDKFSSIPLQEIQITKGGYNSKTETERLLQGKEGKEEAVVLGGGTERCFPLKGETGTGKEG